MGWERIKSDNHQPFYTRRMTAGRANRQALNRGSSGGQASGQAPEPSSRPLPVLRINAQCSTFNRCNRKILSHMTCPRLRVARSPSFRNASGSSYRKQVTYFDLKLGNGYPGAPCASKHSHNRAVARGSKARSSELKSPTFTPSVLLPPSSFNCEYGDVGASPHRPT